MKLARKAINSNLIPESLRLGRCLAGIALGTHPSTFNEKQTETPKVLYRFEILDWHHSYGNTPVINQFYTASAHPKSRLLQDMEKLNGKPFTEEELDALDISWMVGRYCMLNIVHAENKGFMNAKIAEVLPVPPSTVLVDPVYPDRIFSVDAPDLVVFNELPGWIQKMIKESAEWKNFPRTNGWEVHFPNPPEAVNDSPF